MRRTRGMLLLAFLGCSGVIAAACVSGNPDEGRAGGTGDTTVESPSGQESSSSADVIDVTSGSRMSLALRGGLGPIISGQTIHKAIVSMSDLQLVDANGGTVALSQGAFTGDLIALQDRLGQIFSDQSIQAGSFTSMRFRLSGAAIEAQDTQGTATVFATQGFDTSQFSNVQSVQVLQLGGLDNDGFVTCALPPGGLIVRGASSLVLQFAFAQSLVVESGGVWVLTPRCWLVDESTFSSLDVDFEIASGIEESFQSGFEVILLDSNMFPICEVPIVLLQSALFRAHFEFLESFEGPFVAAILPPSGFSLQSSVAFSIDVQASARVSTSISVSSFQRSGQSFDIRTSSQSQVVQRDRQGRVVARTNENIGSVDDVAPTMHHREPVAPGAQAPAPAEIPHLPGNPAPKTKHGRGAPMGMPTSTTGGPGMMPPPTPSGSTKPGMMPPPTPSGSTKPGMMPPPTPSGSTKPGMKPAPTPSGTTGPGTMPTPTPSGSTGRGKMPPTPPAPATGTGTPPPPAPPTPSTGRGKPPSTPPSPPTGPATTPSTPTGPTTAPSAPSGRGPTPPSQPSGNPRPPSTGGPRTGAPTPPPTPASTGAPPSPPSRGGPSVGAPTPPTRGSMSSGNPVPSFGGGRGPAGGPPPSSGGVRGGGGRGPNTRTH